MRPNSSAAAMRPLTNKRPDKSANLPDHDVVALLEATPQDHALSQSPASDPFKGILIGLAAGTVIWLLLAAALLMAWTR
jgi:hypothetical protein